MSRTVHLRIDNGDSTRSSVRVKTKRILVGGATAGSGILLALVLGQACGGQLVIGYDDAGNYHTGDGAVLRKGGKCVGWDASHYFEDGGFICDLNTDECNQWLTPPGWPYPSNCQAQDLLDDAGNYVLDDAGHPIIGDDGGLCSQGISIVGNFQQCDQKDPASDQLCSAFWEQYVTHGTVPGKCAGFGGICGSTELISCDIGITRIDEDGAVECVPPCAP